MKKDDNKFGGMDGMIYLCIIKHTDTMTQQVNTHRELLFVVSEVDETRDPFYIINRINMAYEDGEIDKTQRELLIGTLYRNCRLHGVEGAEGILDYIGK